MNEAQEAPIDAPATPKPDVPLREEIARIVYESDQSSVEQHFDAVKARQDLPVVNDAFDTADLIMQLLMDRGHYLPGAPPAQQILNDAKSFAERLTLSNLTVRIYSMLAWSNVQTPESKPARKWIEDYIDGKNHGPIGHAMLWPHGMPGLAQMLRDWGYMPTPTKPQYVAKALPNPGVQ